MLGFDGSCSRMTRSISGMPAYQVLRLNGGLPAGSSYKEHIANRCHCGVDVELIDLGLLGRHVLQRADVAKPVTKVFSVSGGLGAPSR